jgi:site-specific recombinase XerC
MRQVEYVVEKWSEQAGEVIRPHKLRHHYATRLIRSDAGVFAVQQLLGHASVATTQVYVSLNLGDVVRESMKDPRNQARGKEGLRVVA